VPDLRQQIGPGPPADRPGPWSVPGRVAGAGQVLHLTMFEHMPHAGAALGVVCVCARLPRFPRLTPGIRRSYPMASCGATAAGLELTCGSRTRMAKPSELWSTHAAGQ
jgi:hypothetical protein